MAATARGSDIVTVQGSVPVHAPHGTGEVFDRAIADFSNAYAAQNERDYQALLDAVASGRVTAHTGR